MSRLIGLAVLVGVLLSIRGAPASAQEPCKFVLGFATLRELIGAEKVGACLEDQQTNPENGNAEQRTTGGLMVWRKADNFTAFTDGGTTWVNGPNGLESRPNAERFSWERDPVQSAESGAPQAAPARATDPPPPTATVPAPTEPRSPAPPAPTATRVPPTATPRSQPPAASNCHPSYPDFCIPPPPPDINCNSPVIGGRKNFRVTGPDVHRLDQGGRPGIACES